MRRILIILLCGLFTIKSAMALDPFVVSDIRVEGLQRISEGTVFNYLTIDANELLTAAKARQAIRSLFNTGFFSSIDLEREGDILVIRVQERPAIAAVVLSGNKAIKDEDMLPVLADIGLAQGEVFQPQSLDRIKQELLLAFVIKEKCLGDRATIGHACRFDDDVVELVATLEELPQDTQQIAADGAADAPIVGFEDFLFSANDELMIDADLTELVFDDSDPLAMILGENAVEQGGLSRPQKSRQDGDGHPIRGSHIVVHDNVRHGQNRRVTRLSPRPPALHPARSRYGRQPL